MKKKIIVVWLFATAAILNAQIPALEWSRKFGRDTSIVTSIAVDQVGAVYSTGSFRGTIDFDPGANTVLLTSMGLDDIFISKVDAGGHFLWAKRIGGVANDKGCKIAKDNIGNVYVTGIFEDSVDFDPNQGTLNLISTGDTDFYILKLNPVGDLLWVRAAGGLSADIVSGLAVDTASNVHIAGTFRQNVNFDQGSSNFTLLSAGGNDVFIWKIDNAGSFIWAKSFSGIGNETVADLAIDRSGNVFSTGTFSTFTDFNPNIGVDTLDISVGCTFISKLTAGGNFGWVRNMGSCSGGGPQSIVTDNDGNIYTTGNFNGLVDFDPGPAMTPGNANGGPNDLDIYIHKLNALGGYQWVRWMGDTLFDMGCAITADAYDNLYVTGIFNGVCELYMGSAGPVTISGANHDSNVFLIKMKTNGAYSWAGILAGAGTMVPTCVKADITGSVYSAGKFVGAIDFEPGSLTAVYSSSPVSIYNGFVYKLNSSFTSLSEIDEGKASMKLFPNPAENLFNYINMTFEPNITVEIYNSTGMLILRSPIFEKGTIDLSKEAEGFFVVKFIKNNQIIGSQKIVKASY